jgi:hypothetical protein
MAFTVPSYLWPDGLGPKSCRSASKSCRGALCESCPGGGSDLLCWARMRREQFSRAQTRRTIGCQASVGNLYYTHAVYLPDWL